MIRPFRLVETLLLERGAGYEFLDEHLARMEASARHLGFAFDRRALLGRLERRASGLGRSQARRHRIRALLSKNGALRVESSPLPRPAPNKPFAWLSRSRVDGSRHKTTLRGAYDREFRRLSARTGCFEVLFRNRRGRLTEGSRTNLFIVRGGVWLTPPLSCGLLGGIMRARVLQDRGAFEKVLYEPDLETADQVFVCNSLRGLIEVAYKGEAPL